MLWKAQIISLIVVGIFYTTFAAANTSYSQSTDEPTEHNPNNPCATPASFTFPIEKSTSFQDTLEKRGCCSHHSGVCGCSSNGRQICCDGTLSPSCTC